MKKLTRHKLYFIILFSFLFCCSTSPEGKGKIAHYGRKLNLYQENMLELKVKNNIIDKIYMVNWEVEPTDAANIYYKRNLN